MLCKLMRLRTPDFTSRVSNIRLTKRAQNTEVAIPIARVMPNPFTGPVPSQIKILAVIRVVRLASMIVEKALAYPPSRAFSGLLPALNSSLIRSKIKILASTAIPMVRTKAAIPGKVKVAWKIPAKVAITRRTFNPTEKMATIPPALYHTIMKATTSTAPSKHAFKLLDKAPAANVGETSYCSPMVRDTFSGLLRISDSILASRKLKFPEITALPPPIRSFTVGALSSCPSSTMAKRPGIPVVKSAVSAILPVRSPKVCPPSGVKSKPTSHPPIWSCRG